MTTPTTWTAPTGEPIPLDVEPRLASWDKAGDRDQVALAAFLDHAQQQLGSRPEVQVGLELNVALPEPANARAYWLVQHADLDNFLYPLAKRLGSEPGLDAVWGTKRAGTGSTVRWGRTTPGPPLGGIAVSVSGVSADQVAYKQAVRDQVRQAVIADSSVRPPDQGPLTVEIAFVVGETRNWINLWKPTIDALAPLIGGPAVGWNPHDGRITRLGLYRTIDVGRRWEIDIVVRVRADDSVRPGSTGPVVQA